MFNYLQNKYNLLLKHKVISHHPDLMILRCYFCFEKKKKKKKIIIIIIITEFNFIGDADSSMTMIAETSKLLGTSHYLFYLFIFFFIYFF